MWNWNGQHLFKEELDPKRLLWNNLNVFNFKLCQPTWWGMWHEVNMWPCSDIAAERSPVETGCLLPHKGTRLIVTFDSVPVLRCGSEPSSDFMAEYLVATLHRFFAIHNFISTFFTVSSSHKNRCPHHRHTCYQLNYRWQRKCVYFMRPVKYQWIKWNIKSCIAIKQWSVDT
jgi:hypothetical protein